MLLLCLFLCSVSALALGDRPECCAPLTNTTVRLPKSVVPHRYEILFTTDVADWKFSGEEQIIFEVVEDTNKIVFHSLDLNVESILVNIDGKGIFLNLKTDLNVEYININTPKVKELHSPFVTICA